MSLIMDSSREWSRACRNPAPIRCRATDAAPGAQYSGVLRAHGISEGFFYKLKKQGEGPREMKLGARTLITLESAAEWRRERENATQGDLPWR